MCWIARAAVKKSGQVVCGGMHFSPTDHNGDVPAKWLCVAGSDSPEAMVQLHPNFSGPDFSNASILIGEPNFSNPNLGNELKESDN
jgi:hypothetical protein